MVAGAFFIKHFPWAVVVAQLQSSRFQYQRSAVRIQSSANFFEHLFTVNCIEKTKIKIKEAGNGPFLNHFSLCNLQSFGQRLWIFNCEDKMWLHLQVRNLQIHKALWNGSPVYLGRKVRGWNSNGFLTNFARHICVQIKCFSWD